MPTIQIKLTDKEFQQLQFMTSENTGAKAFMHLFRSYPELHKNFNLLNANHSNLYREHKQLKTKISMFTRLLSDFSEISE